MSFIFFLANLDKKNYRPTFTDFLLGGFPKRVSYRQQKLVILFFQEWRKCHLGTCFNAVIIIHGIQRIP